MLSDIPGAYLLIGTPAKGMMPITGISLFGMINLGDKKSGDLKENYVFSGRERHSSSGYNNWGYPQRAVRSKEYLLVWNMKPKRWPAGDPQRLQSSEVNEHHPKYGIDKNGIHHPEWAFTDIDASPSKSFLV